MIDWKNLDTLSSFGKLKDLKKRVDLTEAMAGSSGAARVAKYSVPIACGLSYNYAAKAVDDEILSALAELAAKVPELLDAVQRGLFERAKKNLDEHIFEAHSIEEAKALQAEHGGFIKTMWCGELDCEMKMKEEAGMSSRCMPLRQERFADVCPICGKPAKHMIYWGVAY